MPTVTTDALGIDRFAVVGHFPRREDPDGVAGLVLAHLAGHP